jgi:hypothetical protein
MPIFVDQNTIRSIFKYTFAKRTYYWLMEEFISYIKKK